MCTSCVQYSIASDDAEAEGHDVVWSKYLNLTFPKRFRHPPHTDEWFAKTPPHRQRVGLHAAHPITHTQCPLREAQAEGVSELLIWYPLLEDECYQLCVGVP